MAEAKHRTPQLLGINSYRPRDQFRELHNRIERWAAMVCHRRAGKTVACIADLVLSALVTKKQNARYGYIAPQFNQAKDIAWSYLWALTSDIPAVAYNVSELRADLPNGSRVRLYGADNPDRLRGIYLDGVILDEYADMKPRVWGEVVRPTLSDRGGWAVFIGTPRGKNEFWEVWSAAQKDPIWYKLRLAADESGILPETELADARRTLTQDQYEQEYLCSFEAAITGAFYGAEMREVDRGGRIRAVPYDEAVPVHTAWDLGHTDDTAIWWFQVIAGEIHLIDFHASSGLGLDDYIKLVGAKPYSYGTHWLPHDAKAKTFAAEGKSTLERAALAFGIERVRIVPSLSVQDGIQAGRKALARCYFDEEKCAGGLEALRQYQREWDEDKRAFRERPRHDWTSHPADAFRMLAVAWQKEREPEPAQKSFDPNYRPTLNELWDAEPRARQRI